MTVDEAKAAYDKGDVVVLDAVDAGEYRRVADEIPGAVRIDPDEIEEAYEQLPRDQTILTYCTCDSEELSARVAYFLRKQGYEAYAIEGGLLEWREAGYPVHEKNLAAPVGG
jgi:rhodanese-related sulfurtransferase